MQTPTTPTQNYFGGFVPFFDGDYRTAVETFLAEGRSAIKTVNARWIDSICYHTMSGECFYHMGDFPKALEHYSSALTLISQYSQWMLRVQFPMTIQAASPAAYKSVPWGASTRGAKIATFHSMLIGMGQLDNYTPSVQGGVIAMPQLKPIDALEIVRCSALAIRRHTELMGPVGLYDPLAASVMAKLAARPGPPNHYSEAWIDVQLGLALQAAGRDAQAIAMLQRSILVAGEYDHPLTPTALLVLGQILMKQGNYTGAAKYFDEATYAAVNFADYEVLEEAFRYGALVHLVTNHKGMFPPLVSAVGWAQARAPRRVYAALLLLAAENAAVLRQTNDAGKLLEQAHYAIGRRTMANGWIGARLQFLTALVDYQQHRIPEGDAAAAAAMSYMRGGSLWLFQINLADNLYTSGAVSITARTAMDLYQNLLREPQAADWTTDPMETLGVLTTPHFGPLEHWFEVALDRKDYESAILIGDRIRRHRFFTTQSFGGRLQALRWLLSGPAEVLDKEALLQRQDLLLRYPAYEDLNRQVEQLRKSLAAKPLVAQTQEQFHAQSLALGQVATLSQQQEVMLREIAVRREPAAMVFPPLRATSDVQKSLAPGHAALVFISTSRHTYAFLLDNRRYGYWEVGSMSSIYEKIRTMLRQMGHYEQNAELGIKELSDQQWKQTGKLILDSLLKGSQADFSQPFEELIIVPDGALWYLPFEALQTTVDKQSRSLISRFRIRYLPTFGLIVNDGRGRKPSGHTAVAVGAMLGHDTEAASRAAMEQLARVVPGSEALKTPMPAPSSVYCTLFDRLVVLEDTPSGEGPFSWFPLPSDKGKTGNTLGDWLTLPWAGPEEIVLPGYHTAAENGLKRTVPATAGNEVFLSVCGLMASGARTVLMSRWRTGGQTSYDIVREFVQELPHAAPSDAFQRAVFLTVDSQLNLEGEPRIKRSTSENELPKATHPFFWAGYMLVDSGGDPRPADAPAAQAPGPAVAPPAVGPAAPAKPADADPPPRPGRAGKARRLGQ
jgi:CHAT domain-containing protein